MSPGLKPSETALILGVDPGGRHTGFGLVLSGPGGLTLVAQGRVSPGPAWPRPRRLEYIHGELSRLIEGHRPSAVAVEDIFHGRNVRSALKLGEVRGVVLLAAAQGGAEIYEYAPRMVKNAVAGYGQADKAQVARMVGELLKCSAPLTPDAADALALAVCHAGRRFLGGLADGAAGSAAGRGRGWRGLSEDDLTALNYAGGAGRQPKGRI